MQYLLIFLLSLCSYAQTIKISVSEDTYNLSPKFISLILQVYKEIGLTPKYIIMPSKRAIKEFEDARFQAMDARSAQIKNFSKRSILIEPAIIDEFKIGLISKLNEDQTKINYDKDYFVTISGSYLGDVYINKYKVKNIINVKS